MLLSAVLVCYCCFVSRANSPQLSILLQSALLFKPDPASAPATDNSLIDGSVTSKLFSELARSSVQKVSNTFVFLFFRTASPVSTAAEFLPCPSRVLLSFFHFGGGFCQVSITMSCNKPFFLTSFVSWSSAILLFSRP